MAEKKTGKMALLLIFLTVFIDLIGFGIIIPLLPKFAVTFGASPFTVGLLVMSYSLMQFIMTPFWGRLSDRIGRRPVLLISLAASAAGYLFWGFAGSLTMLFASRIIAGIGNANIAVAQAYIADITTPENRAKGMGLIGAAFGLGFTLGPAIGGALSPLGIHAVGFAAAAFSFVAFLFAMFALPEPENRSQAGHDRFRTEPGFVGRVLSDKSLRIPLAIFFLSTFAFANMETTLVLLASSWYDFKAADISWLFTFVGFVMVMVQGGYVGRAAKKSGEKKLILTGSLLVAAGFALTVLLHQVWGLYVAMGVMAIGISINNPSNQSLLSKLANPAETGGVLGIGQSLSTLGRILGPIVGGLAYEHLGPECPYYLGAAVMLAVCALATRLPSGKTPSAPGPLVAEPTEAPAAAH
ncbi:MAG: MFS transporter [Candidatus Obscuribacterales bacterium]|nr:MFS transporter [Candidatus Obscuribacterales bacterium]